MSNSTQPPTRGDRALLGLLAIIALLAGLTFARGDDRARADLLYQVSPPTDTPDPNSPFPTPTFTPTPFPTDTPTGPPPEATATLALPTDTPALPTVEPAQPTATLPLLESATAVVDPNLLIVPTVTPAPTITPTATGAAPTPTVRALVILPSQPAAPVPEPRLDPVLFIDNLVIAFGYVWICLGGLLLVILALGAVLFLRRPQRRSVASAPAASPASPAPPAIPPSAPPTSGRVAARHRRRSADDVDR